MNRTPRALVAALAGCGLAAADSGAVRLSPDGRGQALVFPYYSARATAAGVLNTYLTVVNHESRPKVARLRVREGRNARPVLEFDLFLSGYDTWSGAVIPDGDFGPALAGGEGAVLASVDLTCRSPQVMPPYTVAVAAFSNASYSGPLSDGLGAGLERTREGYIEVIEMATLSGAAAAAVTHDAAGVPVNCAAVQESALVASDVEAPTGGLSGTLTLIDVARGMDFTVNADALAQLTSQSFYRPRGALPAVDFDAPEVTPTSVIVARGREHRLEWSRGLHAVSSVFMRTAVLNEHVRDVATASRTEWALAFPTRHLHAGTRPFGTARCEGLGGVFHDREARGVAIGSASVWPSLCAAANVATIEPHPVAASAVLGSSHAQRDAGLAPAGFASGWMELAFTGGNARDVGLVSLPGSTVTDLATGAVTSGSQVVLGLPVSGFMVRTFENGTLTCSSGACQGNYGGAFPHRYRIDIRPAF